MLRHRVGVLRKTMLPARFDPLGNYRASVLNRAMGFRVLSHAEIEAFIEDRVQTVVRAAARRWKHDKKPSKALIGVVSFSQFRIDSLPRQFASDDNLQARIEFAINAFETRLRNSHGIRFHHTVPLLSMAGIEEHEVDQVWLATLDSFGRSRGDIAHKSGGAVTAIDPLSEWSAVKQIVADCHPFDLLISEREKEIGSASTS